MIFKNELAKVFYTLIIFYFISMIFASWIQSLKKYIVQQRRMEEKLKIQKKMNRVNVFQKRNDDRVKVYEQFDIDSFGINDLYQIADYKWDMYILNQCGHFKDKFFVRSMKEMQSLSAIIFFTLIHIPLSRISSLFSPVSSLVLLILNDENKKDIYLKINRLAD